MKDKEFPLCLNRCSSSLKSLSDDMGNKFSSSAHLDALNFESIMFAKDMKFIRDNYNFPRTVELVIGTENVVHI